MFTVKNNVKSKISLPIITTDLVVKVDSIEWFPDNSEAPFLATIRKINSSELTILREIVQVTAVSWNFFTIERAYWICPIWDLSQTQVQTPYDFDKWDIIELNVPAELIQQMQDEIQAKVSQSEYSQEKQAFGASSTWNDDYESTISWITSYVNWQTFKIQADVANTWASTLNINSLWAINIEKLDWWFIPLIDWDIAVNQIFWATYNTNWWSPVFQFSVDPWTAVSAWTDINWLAEKTTPIWDDEAIIYDSAWLVNVKTKIRSILDIEQKYIWEITFTNDWWNSYKSLAVTWWVNKLYKCVYNIACNPALSSSWVFSMRLNSKSSWYSFYTKDWTLSSLTTIDISSNNSWNWWGQIFINWNSGVVWKLTYSQNWGWAANDMTWWQIVETINTNLNNISFANTWSSRGINWKVKIYEIIL